jgi:tRNA-dihydrouridine synthase
MDGVTDAGFRAIVAQQGKPDVTFTEFTHVHDVCRGAAIRLETLIYSEIERPMVAQLYGKDPDLFYQAAHAVCELGFDGLDINMGCPSKSVASSGSGAGLIRTPELAHSIVHAARQGIEDWASGQRLDEVGFKAAQIAEFHRLNRQRGSSTAVARRILPISVKTRLGYDAVMVESWVEQLLQEQPAVISLHGRTLQQMYRGAADWSAIARAACLSKGTETLLFGNGDVQSLEEAAMRIRETGVDGVLVGRAVLGAPWFFRSKELARALAAGASPQSWRSNADEGIGLDQRFAVLLDHARQFQALFGPGQFHRMRKHLGWYCKAFPHAATLRARMFRVSSVSELEALLADYWAHRIVDSIEAVPIEDATMPTPRCS